MHVVTTDWPLTGFVERVIQLSDDEIKTLREASEILENIRQLIENGSYIFSQQSLDCGSAAAKIYDLLHEDIYA